MRPSCSACAAPPWWRRCASTGSTRNRASWRDEGRGLSGHHRNGIYGVILVRTNYIFIIGVQKAGTTALAGWLVRNGFAAYAVPDVKEPGNFLRFGLTSPLPPPRGDVPLLDAST